MRAADNAVRRGFDRLVVLSEMHITIDNFSCKITTEAKVKIVGIYRLFLSKIKI